MSPMRSLLYLLILMALPLVAGESAPGLAGIHPKT